MLARKEEVGSSKAQGVAGAASSAAAANHDVAVSEFVARFGEAARKRLDRMNEKLKKLETQMEALEAEMSRASGFSQWD
ncbi:uncharacterized protein LOC121982561 isoform X2 [Zingiber officinale]|uniref:Uncharacterized protein n=1 Tax=Zingiber officinale TaxID=94328 RepID=A0A8J5GSN3_ZINOF|nr:uncharacterized protein LOC121982561 isoform X2 [Zingiber officinale]KAG6505899.1 hypothetical protein ZIOFF_031212 [Zingiber officinale]